MYTLCVSSVRMHIYMFECIWCIMYYNVQWVCIWCIMYVYKCVLIYEWCTYAYMYGMCVSNVCTPILPGYAYNKCALTVSEDIILLIQFIRPSFFSIPIPPHVHLHPPPIRLSNREWTICVDVRLIDCARTSRDSHLHHAICLHCTECRSAIFAD